MSPAWPSAARRSLESARSLLRPREPRSLLSRHSVVRIVALWPSSSGERLAPEQEAAPATEGAAATAVRASRDVTAKRRPGRSIRNLLQWRKATPRLLRQSGRLLGWELLAFADSR